MKEFKIPSLVDMSEIRGGKGVPFQFDKRIGYISRKKIENEFKL